MTTQIRHDELDHAGRDQRLLDADRRDAIGPATAVPSGIRTNEPSASYELTRERAASGTCRWKTVNQSARWIASPMPATT